MIKAIDKGYKLNVIKYDIVLSYFRVIIIYMQYEGSRWWYCDF